MGKYPQSQKPRRFPRTYLYPERLHRIAAILSSCLKFQQKSKETSLVLKEFVSIFFSLVGQAGSLEILRSLI